MASTWAGRSAHNREDQLLAEARGLGISRQICWRADGRAGRATGSTTQPAPQARSLQPSPR
jgi:hypothetical protein